MLLARLGPHPPRLQGRLQLPGINDGSSLGNIQVVAAATLPNYEIEIKRLTAGCSVSVDGQVKASPGKGQATEVEATSVTVHGWADPESYPLAEERASRSSSSARSPTCGRGPTPSAPSPGCGTASAARSTSSSRKKASSTSTRRSSPPATAKGPARCSRSPRSTWTSRRRRRSSPAGKSTSRQDFFDRPAYLTVSGQLEAETFACAPGQGLHLRPHLPRRELQHVPAPGRVLDGRARDGLLRADRQHGPGRAVPEADLPRRADPLPRRTWSSSASGSTTR